MRTVVLQFPHVLSSDLLSLDILSLDLLSLDARPLKPGELWFKWDMHAQIAVNEALKEQGIPIKHFQLDSWWYGEGWNNGVALWEDIPQCN